MNVLVKLNSLDIDVERVWQGLGYQAAAQAPDRIQQVFQRALACGEKLLEPKACYNILSVEGITPFSITLRGASLKSKALAARCHDTKEIAVFLVTIGVRLEERVKELFAGEDPAMGFILDSFGSEAMTMVFYQLRDIANDYAQMHGLQVNGWFCPGWTSVDWNICELKTLLSLVDGKQVGVRLKESCMMSPQKSYAGVLPLGPG